MPASVSAEPANPDKPETDLLRAKRECFKAAEAEAAVERSASSPAFGFLSEACAVANADARNWSHWEKTSEETVWRSSTAARMSYSWGAVKIRGLSVKEQ